MEILLNHWIFTLHLCVALTQAPYERGLIIWGAEFTVGHTFRPKALTCDHSYINAKAYLSWRKRIFSAAAHGPVSLNLVRTLQNLFLAKKQTNTHTHTLTHWLAQVLGSIYCGAACQCNSSGMSIRAENRSFHSISHSNELQQSFLGAPYINAPNSASTLRDKVVL